jgi:predicted nuclease of restriction endonuclease-like RecB superfamily
VEVPPPIVKAQTLLCPDLAIDIAGARWWIEIIGFWTTSYLELKLARYREAGIANVLLCVDETRACTDAETPFDPRVIGYRRSIDAERVLEMMGTASESARRPG